MRPARAVPSRLDPSLSLSEQERRYRLAPVDKAGARTKAQREAFWIFRDLVEAAGDAGVSRRAIAMELGMDESYLNGLLAPGDTRMPSAAHLVGVLLSTQVPEPAKRVIYGVLGELAGVVSHVKAGGLARTGHRALAPAEVAMSVALETGGLVGAIASAVDPASEGGQAITDREAKTIRREAGEAAQSCTRAGVALGGLGGLGVVGTKLDVEA